MECYTLSKAYFRNSFYFIDKVSRYHIERVLEIHAFSNKSIGIISEMIDSALIYQA